MTSCYSFNSNKQGLQVEHFKNFLVYIILYMTLSKGPQLESPTHQ